MDFYIDETVYTGSPDVYKRQRKQCGALQTDTFILEPRPLDQQQFCGCFSIHTHLHPPRLKPPPFSQAFSFSSTLQNVQIPPIPAQTAAMDIV